MGFPSCKICATQNLEMLHEQQNALSSWMGLQCFTEDKFQDAFEHPLTGWRRSLGCNTPGDSFPRWSESKGYKHDKAKIYKGINPLWEENKVVKRSRPYLESVGVGRR